MENTLDWKRANNGSIYYSCAPCKKSGFIATPRCPYQPSVPPSPARCWPILDRGVATRLQNNEKIGVNSLDSEDKKRTHFRDGGGFNKKPSTPLGTGNVLQFKFIKNEAY